LFQRLLPMSLTSLMILLSVCLFIYLFIY
jgi:hypothetical protein